MRSGKVTLSDSKYLEILTKALTDGFLGNAEAIAYFYTEKLLPLKVNAAMNFTTKIKNHIAAERKKIDQLIAEKNAEIEKMGKKPLAEPSGKKSRADEYQAAIGSLKITIKSYEESIVELHESFGGDYAMSIDESPIDLYTRGSIKYLNDNHFTLNISNFATDAFGKNVLKIAKNLLDRAIFVAMCNTNHYVAAPIILGSRPVAFTDSSAASEDDDSKLETSSDLDSNSDNGDFKLTGSPDGTIAETIVYPPVAEINVTIAYKQSNTQKFLWDFI